MIEHFSLVQQALAQLDHSAVQRAIDIIKAAKQRGSMVFICGNGGSAATASHFACDLQKAARVRAIALTDNVPLITAWANDWNYGQSFAGQLINLIKPSDVLILISCSGNSKNIITTIDQVRAYASLDNVDIIAMSGGMANMRMFTREMIKVQSEDYGVIEDCHLAICHAITKGVASEGG